MLDRNHILKEKTWCIGWITLNKFDQKFVRLLQEEGKSQKDWLEDEVGEKISEYFVLQISTSKQMFIIGNVNHLIKSEYSNPNIFIIMIISGLKGGRASCFFDEVLRKWRSGGRWTGGGGKQGCWKWNKILTKKTQMYWMIFWPPPPPPWYHHQIQEKPIRYSRNEEKFQLWLASCWFSFWYWKWVPFKNTLEQTKYF